MKKAVIALLICTFILAQATALIDNNNFQEILSNETIKITLAIADNVTSGFFKTTHSIDKTEVIGDLSDRYNVEYIARTFNGLTLEVNKTELEELQKRKDVLDINKAFEFNTLLQDSNSIINSTLAGNLQVNGVNLTGQGQTVCIIDSGVNYSHPAFGGCTTAQFLSGNCSKVIGGYAYYNPVNVSNPNDIMGDTNHGTHVAGIVAGSGSIRGIAPDAKIVAMKACGPTTACDGYALIDSINWCALNYIAYNISVISISIGTAAPDLYDAYCDYESPTLSNAINSAVGKNISVVIAAGNDGNRTHISLPACMANATAVGAVNKNDAIAGYSNRNFLLSLMTPGSSINSTVLNGYGLDSGTSMATPHVAAAIAVLRQVLALTNTQMRPIQITQILNSTGKTISDVTGVNYSRINLYNSVISLDSISPELNLANPLVNTLLINDSLTFSANISDWNLTNMTFQLRNSSGFLLNETNFNLSGTFNQTSLEIQNLINGTYNFSFIGFDSKANSGSLNRTLTLTNSNITLVSPVNGYSETTNSANLIFNFTLLNNFTNCSLILNNNKVKNFSVIDYTTNQNVSYTLSPGSYTWDINCSYENISELSNGARTMTISAPVEEAVVVRSSGGGGGGGASPTIVVNETQIVKGYTKVLGKQEIVQFVLFDSKSSKHTLTVNSIGKDYVNMTIRSDPIKLTLGVGQSAKLNLTSLNFYDLLVKLESIINGKAEITIQTINEPKAIFPERSNSSENFNFTTLNESENLNENVPVEKKSKSTLYLGLLLLAVSLAVLITHAIDMRRRRHMKYFGNHKI